MKLRVVRSDHRALVELGEVIRRTRGEWARFAACKRYPLPRYGHWWFPSGIREIDPQAKKVCDGCPVQNECLEYGMAVEGNQAPGERQGIFGGKTRAERAKLFRQRSNIKRVPSPPREPVFVTCQCGCGQRFDSSRTTSGRRANTPKVFASIACQRRVLAEKNRNRRQDSA